jgi:hypothetical protein
MLIDPCAIEVKEPPAIAAAGPGHADQHVRAASIGPTIWPDLLGGHAGSYGLNR